MSARIDLRPAPGHRAADREPDRVERRAGLAGLAAVNAVAAWAGAVGLLVGWIDFGARLDRRLPFDSLVLAGVALAVGVAVPLTALARAAWTRSARTDDLALLTGLLLIGWIVLQVLVLQSFSLFQPIYLAIGAWLVAASHHVHLSPRTRGPLLVGSGAVSLAAGLGLVPHLLHQRIAVASAAAVILLLGGTTLVGCGVRSAWRGRRLLARIGTAAGSVLAAALAVSVIAPAVAATHVRPTAITGTPASVGLGYEAVTLRTTDGVELAAWYIPGSNGAGLVVLHGAGSTRTDVLDQSAVLADGGYALLLLDARGHGDSQGTAMDFGWYGDLDIAAGTRYLATRPDVDPDRIGIIGFSMGGEEAIGAAATDPYLRVVVAEGATARRAADKDWLSEAYGWRGRAQEGIEHLQDAVTDYLTEASPPRTLRSAVADARNTHFLLITAGHVDDEARAATFIASAAPGRTTIWTVPEAEHTGGYATAPAQWRHHVLDFLDRHLR